MATQLVKKELEPPEAFPFPFTPYDIQKDFMRELYLTLERGQVGIFESPTGTVKYIYIITSFLIHRKYMQLFVLYRGSL